MSPEWDIPAERDEPRSWLWSAAKFSSRKVYFRFRFSRAPPAHFLRGHLGFIICRCLLFILINMSENEEFSSDGDTSEEEIASNCSGDEAGEWSLVRNLQKG
jgi:hypothetical protein